MTTTRLRLAALLSLALPFVSAHGAVQYRVAHDSLAPLSAPLAAGARVQLRGVPLFDGEPASLELEQFEVWAPGAEIRVFGPDGIVDETLDPPPARYFRGTVAGQPDSVVFIAVSGAQVDGLIYAGDRKFAVGAARLSRTSKDFEIVVEESSVLDDFPADGQTFTCEVEKASVAAAGRPRAVTDAAGLPVANAAPAGTQRSVVNLAVDTDYELYVNAGSTAANVTTFIGNLVGATSVIYARDLLTEVRIAWLGVRSNSSDPFNVVPGSGGATSLDALLELGNVWHTAPPTTVKHSAVTLISGKPQLAGIAWMGTLCEADFAYQAGYGGAYSFCGGIDPPASLAVPDPDANAGYTAPSSNYWPLLQLAHELGHNVGSPHTHCIALSDAQATQYGKPISQDFVDSCYSGEGGCYSGTTSVPTEKGSIMSYCHLKGGGTQTRFTFGQALEPSEIVRSNMRGYMASVTPALSSITSSAPSSIGEIGSASVTSTAGISYGWTISNGTFAGGVTSATGASVTFTASASPVTVRVTATNAAGCSVTDSKSITVSAGSVSTPTGLVADATSATSVNVSWNAATGATGYRVFRSASDMAFVQIATTTLPAYVDDTAAANASYLYRVQAVNGGTVSGNSNYDVATTVVFTDPILGANAALRAVHITELRTAVDSLLELAVLPKPLYTDGTITTSTLCRKAHIDELREALNMARTDLGLGALSFSEPIAAGTTVVKATHIEELRSGVE